MPIISQEDAAYLRELFAERLTGDVTLRFYTERQSGLAVSGDAPCATCRDTHALLNEVVDLSDHLRLEVHDFYADREQAEAQGITEIPSIVLEGRNRGQVRYTGAPAGYEFSGFIEDLIDISSGTTALQPASRKILSELREPVHIKVFVTPT